MSAEVYYYGCVGEGGHYWHGTRSRHRAPEVPEAISSRVDGGFCPGVVVDAKRPGGTRETRPQVECVAALHHVAGWTVLAWWDRSVDSRPGSNSALVAQGTLGVGDVVALGRLHFPDVMARQRAALRVEEWSSDLPAGGGGRE